MEISLIFIIGGIFLSFLSTILSSFEIYPFFRLYYIFAWYSYIFFIDGINYIIKRDSLIISRKKEFFYMLSVSCGIWSLFEIFNLSADNWKYYMLPFDSTDRHIFYILLFSAILPALFETEEFIESSGIFSKIKIKINIKLNEKTLKILFYTGIFLALLSISYPKIFFPFLWISFVLIFEPLNYKYGTRSLVKETANGNVEKILSISSAAVICCALLEVWSRAAGSKIIYTIPYSNSLKIFNTPLLCYIIFIFFTTAAYSIYNFLSYFKKGVSWEYDSQTQLSTAKSYRYFYTLLFILIILLFFISTGLIDRYSVNLYTLV